MVRRPILPDHSVRGIAVTAPRPEGRGLTAHQIRLATPRSQLIVQPKQLPRQTCLTRVFRSLCIDARFRPIRGLCRDRLTARRQSPPYRHPGQARCAKSSPSWPRPPCRGSPDGPAPRHASPPCAENVSHVGLDVREVGGCGREPFGQFVSPRCKLVQLVHHAKSVASAPEGGTTDVPADKREFARCRTQASRFS